MGGLPGRSFSEGRRLRRRFSVKGYRRLRTFSVRSLGSKGLARKPLAPPWMACWTLSLEGVGGEDENGDLGAVGVLVNGLHDLKAGGVGHLDVEDDDVGWVLGDVFNAFAGILESGDLESSHLQDVLDGGDRVGIVIDDVLGLRVDLGNVVDKPEGEKVGFVFLDRLDELASSLLSEVDDDQMGRILGDDGSRFPGFGDPRSTVACVTSVFRQRLLGVDVVHHDEHAEAVG